MIYFLNLKIRCLLLTTFLFLNVAHGQTFIKTYQGGFSNSMVATSDGGYIISGMTTTTYSGSCFLTKIDVAGNVMWHKTYSDLLLNYTYLSGASVIQTLDGGYAVCGEARGGGNEDFYLLKVDVVGNPQFIKTYDEPDGAFDWGQNIIQLPDSSFIINGFTFYGSNPPAIFEGWVIHVSSLGNVIWDKAFYRPPFTSIFNNITHAEYLTDGNILLTGETNDTISGFNAWLIKTDQAGNVLWEKNAGTMGWDEYYSSKQNQGGNLISYGLNNNGSVQLLKTTHTGGLIWQKRYFNAGKTYYSGEHKITSDNGMILAGIASNDGNGSGDAFLIKTDSSGNIQWSKTYGTCYSEFGGNYLFKLPVLQTADGGYIMCFNSGGFQNNATICVIKTDSLGNIADSCFVNNLPFSVSSPAIQSGSGYLTYDNIAITSPKTFSSVAPLINTYTPDCTFFADYTMSNDTICMGDSINFIDVSGTQKPCSWLWDFGDPLSGAFNTSTLQNPSHTFNNAGTFNITLTSTWLGGQMDTITYQVLVSPFPTVNILGSSIICSGESDTLIAGGSNITSGATYLWSTGSINDTLIVNPVVTTTYSLIITNLGGCNDSASFQVTVLPTSFFSQNLTICQGDSLFVGGAWQTTAGTFNDTIPNGAANGCDSIITTNLTINPSAISNTVAAICQGDSLFVGGAWQTTAGTFNDTIPNGAANGCDSIITTNLTVNNISTGTDVQTACDSLTWIDGNNYSASTTTPTFTIVGGAANGCDSLVILNLTITTPTVTNQAFVECEGFSIAVGTNTYTTTGVFVDVLNGCDTVITDLTITPAPSLTLIKADDNCGENIGSVVANVISVNPPVTYSWNNGSSDSIISNLPAGTYTVTVNDGSGCVQSGSINIENLQLDCDFFVYTPNMFSPNGDGQNDVFFVRGKGIVGLSVKIYNRWGNKVFEINDVNQGWDGTYKGSDQNTGVFVYMLEAAFLNGKTVTQSGNVSLVR